MKTLLVLIAGALLLASGCSRKAEIRSGNLDNGLVVVLPGIEGRSGLNKAICSGLAEGGVTAAVELYDWTSPMTPLLTPMYNQRAYHRNQQRARDLAQRIVRYRGEHPGKPVVLVGQSGGAAIAIWAAEQLPQGQSVDGIVLLAASVSPEYDLEPALAKSRRGIVNFHSAGDFILLGFGTLLTGTMDGEHSQSAGRAGFSVPSSGPRTGAYSKLFQIPWQPEMAKSGDIGLHLSSGAPRFVANYVAPLVRVNKWNEDVVSRVLHHEPVTSIMKSEAAPARPPTVPTSRPAVEKGPATTSRPPQSAIVP